MIDKHAMVGKHNIYMANIYNACYKSNTYILYIYDEEFSTTKEFSTEWQ